MGGDPTSRQALQNLGQQRVETDPEGFCRAVLAAGRFMPGENFVMDGLRHKAILRILARLTSPSTVRLLFLDATEASRAARVAIRANDSDFQRAQAHDVEAELFKELRTQADLVVNGDQPFEGVVAKCLAAVETWR